MSILDFWADPVGWLLDSFFWRQNGAPWELAVALLFWSAVFAKAIVGDWWERRARRRSA